MIEVFGDSLVREDVGPLLDGSLSSPGLSSTMNPDLSATPSSTPPTSSAMPSSMSIRRKPIEVLPSPEDLKYKILLKTKNLFLLANYSKRGGKGKKDKKDRDDSVTGDESGWESWTDVSVPSAGEGGFGGVGVGAGAAEEPEVVMRRVSMRELEEPKVEREVVEAPVVKGKEKEKKSRSGASKFRCE